MLAIKALFVGYYKDINILQGVNLNAEATQITSIIGPNGVGKSTLLKAVYGFLKPNSGKIFYEGRDITGMDPYRAAQKGLAYIPQRRNVFPYLSVTENMEMGGWTYKRDKQRMREKLEENFNRFPNLVHLHDVPNPPGNPSYPHPETYTTRLILSPSLTITKA